MVVVKTASAELCLSGVRGFELQVLDDPSGGAYAYSAGLKLAGQDPLVSPDLLKPGVKVGFRDLGFIW